MVQLIVCQWLRHMNLKRELNFLGQESRLEGKMVWCWGRTRNLCLWEKQRCLMGILFTCCLVQSKINYLSNMPPTHPPWNCQLNSTLPSKHNKVQTGSGRMCWTEAFFKMDKISTWVDQPFGDDIYIIFNKYTVFPGDADIII